jgi:hypothetical protein
VPSGRQAKPQKRKGPDAAYKYPQLKMAQLPIFINSNGPLAVIIVAGDNDSDAQENPA